MSKTWLRAAGALVAASVAGSAFATVAYQADFSSFAGGNLVGQDGWAQAGASALLPLQVSGGRMVLPGLPTGSGDNQDARRTFTPITSMDGESLYVGMTINVDTVLAPNTSTSGSSFLFALNTTDAGAFTNLRLVTRQGTAPGTFQFGIRSTGQSGNVFTFGGDLPLNVDLALVLAWDFFAGTVNDEIAAWVNPLANDRGSNLPYVTGVQSNATGDAPGFGGIQFSQFTSSTISQTGATIGRAIVATTFEETQSYVPTPGAAALLGLGGLMAARRRRA
jgi:hypothetical protein